MMIKFNRGKTSHKYISCLLVISMLFSMLPFHAFAMTDDITDYGQVGESVYAELTEDGALILSGNGDTYDYSPDSPAPWYADRASILSAEIENGITSLGDYLFYNCENLTGKLLLPESLISIGECAFSGDGFMNAPKLRAIFNEFRKAEVLSDVAETPDAPAPDDTYAIGPDTEIIPPASSEESSPAELDSTPAEFTRPVDEVMTGGENSKGAPPADADDAPSDELPVSNEPEAKEEPDNEEPVDVPSDESPEEGPDTVTIGDGLPPLAALYMDLSEEPPDEETANPSDDEPAAGESSVERESVLLTEQRIGADVFFPGQSGAYYCMDENVSFIDAMEAAGYIRASALVPVTYTDSSGNQYAPMGLLTEYGLLLENFRKPLETPQSDAMQVYSFIGWTAPSEEAPVEETPIDDVSGPNENAVELPVEPVLYGAWSFAPYEKENPRFTACFELTARRLAERTLEKDLGGQRVTLTGNLPENAELSVEVISLSDAEALINGRLESEAHPTVHFAYDVTLLVDGKKYQPADYGESVRIRVENAALPENGGSLSILHIKDDDTAEDLTVESASETAVEFTADSFSPIVGYSLPFTVWDGTTDTTWYNTTDTEFIITTAEQLAGFSTIVNGTADGITKDTFYNKTVSLGADIRLNDEAAANWTDTARNFPHIGISSEVMKYFSGVFDGGGHTVSGLYNTSGLFGKAQGTELQYAVIKNLTISGYVGDNAGPAGGVVATAKYARIENCVNHADITAYGYAGGVVGSITQGRVENCHNTGTVKTTNIAYEDAGGIVGGSAGSTIEDCSNTGDISGVGDNTGGVAGFISNVSLVQRCYNTGNLSGGNNVGGVVGKTAFQSMVQNSWNTGNVLASGGSVGGIAGTSNNSTVKPTLLNCYNTGDVFGGQYAGGIEGYIFSDCMVKNCYSTGNVTGTTYVGALTGPVSNSTVANCYFLKIPGKVNSSLKAVNTALTATGPFESLGYFTDSDESLTASNETTLAYGDNLFDALNAWVSENIETYPELMGWKIAEGENDGYPVLDPSPILSGNWADEGNYDTSWYLDDTSKASYTLTTPEQLAGLSVLTNGDDNTNAGYYRTETSATTPTGALLTEVHTFSGVEIRLGADIALNTEVLSRQWASIGTYADATANSPFSGTFDGGGHTVNGLYIDTTQNYQGLFGYVKGANASSRAALQNLTVSGSVRGVSPTGGIVGRADYTVIQSCINTGSVAAGSSTSMITGGVAGLVRVNSLVQNCVNTGNVVGEISAGGVIGRIGYDSDIKNCYNTADVSVTGTTPASGSVPYAGGVIGELNFRSTLANCYNIGGVTCLNGSAGGVLGHFFSGTTAGACYYLKTGDNASLDATPARGGTPTSLGYFVDNGGALTKSADLTNTDLAYGDNLLDALNGYVAANIADNPTLMGWKIAEGENGGYPVLDPSPILSGNWADEGNYDTSWYLDDTSKASYTLTTPEQLAGLSVLTNGDDNTNTGYYKTATGTTDKTGELLTTRYNFSGITITLGTDIALNIAILSRQWTPIGNYAASTSNVFSGIFDGAGHTVSGLYINSDGRFQGLFGYVSAGGMLKSLVISGDISGVFYVGGLVGSCYGTVQNCNNTAEVKGSVAIGGLAGHLNSGSMTGCYNRGNVTGGGNVGGVAGTIYYSDVKNCANYGIIITGSNSNVGGVTGMAYQTTVQNVYNTGSVNNTGSEEVNAAGGVVGLVQGGGILRNCYSTGAITATGSDVGGITGQQYGLNPQTQYGYFLSTSSAKAVGTNTDGIVTSLGAFADSGGTLAARDGTTLAYGNRLLDALNAWVDAQDDESLQRWVVAAGENNGYPILVTLAKEPRFAGDEIYYRNGGYYASEADALSETNAIGDYPIMQDFLDTIDKSVLIHMMSAYSVTDAQVINGGTAYDVTLLRHGSYTDYLISIPDGEELTLKNITIDGGAVWAPGELTQDTVNSGTAAQKAAISVIGGKLTIDSNAVIQNNDNNKQDGLGGGIYVNETGSLYMKDGAVRSNRVTLTNCAGGGIYSYGSVLMTGGDISGNYAWYGGAICAISGTVSTVVEGGSISNNRAAAGGGLNCTNLTVKGGEIKNNIASHAGGGLIVAHGSSEISGGEISGNNASTGGGVECWSNGTAEIEQSILTISGGVISNNTGTIGAGIFNINTKCAINITGGTIIGNTNADGTMDIENRGVLTVTGGSIATITGTIPPTNGISQVYSNTITIAKGNAQANTPQTNAAVAAIASTVDYPYGTNDVFSDDSGKLYFWLPEDANTTRVTTVDHLFSGNITSAAAGASATFYTAAGNVQYVNYSIPTSIRTNNDGLTPSTGCGLKEAYMHLADGGGVVYVVGEAMPLSNGSLILSGTSYLSSSMTEAITISNGSVEIRRHPGDGRYNGYESAYTGALFNADGTLTLSDIIIDGNKSNVTALAPLVDVPAGGHLNIQSGAVLQNNYNGKADEGFAGGGAVRLVGDTNGNQATMTMSGGLIANNYAAYSGGGVRCIYASSFNMTGGSITGNSTISTGGGIQVYSSTANQANLIINGGSITNNSAGQGGGICVNGGNVSLQSGAISGNRAVANGGGLSLLLSAGSTSFVLSGGELSDNAARNLGNGVFVGNTSAPITMSVSGAPNIGLDQTVYLDDTQTVAVTGPYTGSAIPVTGANWSPGRVVAQYSEGYAPILSNFNVLGNYKAVVDAENNRIILGSQSMELTAAGEGVSLGAGQSRSATFDLSGLFTAGNPVYITNVQVASAVEGFSFQSFGEVWENRRNYGSADSNTIFGVSAKLTGGSIMDVYADSSTGLYIPLGAMEENSTVTFTVYNGNAITQGGTAGTLIVTLTDGASSYDIEITINRRSGGQISVTVPLRVTGVMGTQGDFIFSGTADYSIKNFSDIPITITQVEWAWRKEDGVYDADDMFYDYTLLTGMVSFGGKDYSFSGAAPAAAFPVSGNTIIAHNGIIPGELELGWGMTLGEGNYMKSAEPANVASITYTIGAAQ